MDNPPEASKHRSPVRGDTNDDGHLTEEPCEVETLTHGVVAGAGGAIPSPTVTGARPTNASIITNISGRAR